MARTVRKQKKKATPIYVHFAVVTVGVTALVGLLADGEAKDAIAEHQARKAQQERLAQAEAVSRGNRQLIREGDMVDTGSFAPVATPELSPAGFSSSSLGGMKLREAEGTGNVPVWVKLGLTREEWESLTDAERAGLEAALADGKVPTKTRSVSVSVLAQASRQRSGRGGASFGSSADDPTSDF